MVLIGAIDQGTSSSRFLIFELSTGEMLASHQVYRPPFPDSTNIFLSFSLNSTNHTSVTHNQNRGGGGKLPAKGEKKKHRGNRGGKRKWIREMKIDVPVRYCIINASLTTRIT
jgi:hypothetical protein